MSSRKNIPTISIFKLILFSLAVFVLTAEGTHAATLGISPYSQTVSVGKIVTVQVVVDSQNQSINAVSGGVVFNNNLLSLVGISKSNSIVSLWAQAPSYSNTAGTASFQGVILNGYTGSNGVILTLSFKANTTGTATIGLSSGSSSVLLNDGQGTNVLSNTTNGTVAVTPVVAQPVSPNTRATPPETVAPKASLPQISDYQQTLLSNNYVVIKGTATPNSVLTVTLTSGSSVVQSTVAVGSDGDFTYVSDKRVSSGIYTVTIATNDGQQLPPITITVKNPLSFILISWITVLVSIKISFFWILLLLALCFYIWHRNRVLRRHIQDALDKIHSLEQK